MQPVGQQDRAQAWMAARKKNIILIVAQILCGLAIIVTSIVNVVAVKSFGSMGQTVVGMFAGMFVLAAGCFGVNAVRFELSKHVIIIHCVISGIGMLLIIIAAGFAVKGISRAGEKECERDFWTRVQTCKSVNVTPSVFQLIFLIVGFCFCAYSVFMNVKKMKESSVNEQIPPQYPTAVSYQASAYPTANQAYPPQQPSQPSMAPAYPTPQSPYPPPTGSGYPSYPSQNYPSAPNTASVSYPQLQDPNLPPPPSYGDAVHPGVVKNEKNDMGYK